MFFCIVCRSARAPFQVSAQFQPVVSPFARGHTPQYELAVHAHPVIVPLAHVDAVPSQGVDVPIFPTHDVDVPLY